MSTVYNRVGTAMVPEESKTNVMHADDMVFMTTDTRNMKTITQKNGELVREIYRKVCDIVKFVTDNECDSRPEPDIKCLLDDLEVQNATMCNTIERLDFLIDMMGMN